MPKLGQGLNILKDQISKFDTWFKRVMLHEKSAIYKYKKNELDSKFNQYHRFLEVLKNYEMITLQDARQSWNEMSEKKMDEEDKLAKTIWPENDGSNKEE